MVHPECMESICRAKFRQTGTFRRKNGGNGRLNAPEGETAFYPIWIEAARATKKSCDDCYAAALDFSIAVPLQA